MVRIERVREVLTSPLSAEYIRQQAEAGWTLAAVVWEREVEAGEQPSSAWREDVPFGLKVSDDCLHLEENTTEKDVLVLIMEQIVQDKRLSQVADELNLRGFRTRSGSKWAAGAVFDMLPRLIEVGPRIFSSSEWAVRRRQLFKAV